MLTDVMILVRVKQCALGTDQLPAVQAAYFPYSIVFLAHVGVVEVVVNQG